MIIEEPPAKQKKLQNLPWIEKYRPSKLLDIVAHHDIISTISKFIDERKLPNLLLYGQPGTGKTSTIVALAKELYGNRYQEMVLELNASDDRGISTVRDVIKGFVASQAMGINQKTKIKLVIMDEADAMTSAAQFALRRIIEKYARNARFCFICNYVSKIIPALQSRCTRFKFNSVPEVNAIQRLREICSIEELSINDNALSAVYKLSEGDMRRAVNLLQSLSIGVQGQYNSIQIIDQHYVYQFTGQLNPLKMQEIINFLLNFDDIKNGFLTLKRIMQEEGISLQILLKELGFKLMEYKLPNAEYIYKNLSEIEYRMSQSCDEWVQLGGLLGVFLECRYIMNGI